MQTGCWPTAVLGALEASGGRGGAVLPLLESQRPQGIFPGGFEVGWTCFQGRGKPRAMQEEQEIAGQAAVGQKLGFGRIEDTQGNFQFPGLCDSKNFHRSQAKPPEAQGK